MSDDWNEYDDALFGEHNVSIWCLLVAAVVPFVAAASALYVLASIIWP